MLIHSVIKSSFTTSSTLALSKQVQGSKVYLTLSFLKSQAPLVLY